MKASKRFYEEVNEEISPELTRKDIRADYGGITSTFTPTLRRGDEVEYRAEDKKKLKGTILGFSTQQRRRMLIQFSDGYGDLDLLMDGHLIQRAWRKGKLIPKPDRSINHLRFRDTAMTVSELINELKRQVKARPECAKFPVYANHPEGGISPIEVADHYCSDDFDEERDQPLFYLALGDITEED